MRRYYLFLLALWLFRNLRNTILHRLKLPGFTTLFIDLEIAMEKAATEERALTPSEN
jgi:hypothetical protein